jgi:type IV secretory pathway VirB10-like protein
MKRFVMVGVLFLLTACGPSEKDINNTAIITCNVMAESQSMDGAMRIKEVNAARTTIGADPYLGNDATIRDSLKFSLCESLIKNDPAFSENLRTAKKELRELEMQLAEERRKREAREAEARRIRLARLQEEQRVKEAKEAEERRIRLAKLEEERARKAKEKAERERIALEREKARELAAKKQAIERYRTVCPRPSQLYGVIDKALELRDSALVRKLQACPGP